MCQRHYLMIILDETPHEEESRKEAHENRTDGTKIGGEMGLDGERRKTYSAAVIDGCDENLYDLRGRLYS